MNGNEYYGGEKDAWACMQNQGNLLSTAQLIYYDRSVLALIIGEE